MVEVGFKTVHKFEVRVSFRVRPEIPVLGQHQTPLRLVSKQESAVLLKVN